MPIANAFIAGTGLVLFEENPTNLGAAVSEILAPAYDHAKPVESGTVTVGSPEFYLDADTVEITSKIGTFTIQNVQIDQLEFESEIIQTVWTDAFQYVVEINGLLPS